MLPVYLRNNYLSSTASAVYKGSCYLLLIIAACFVMIIPAYAADGSVTNLISAQTMLVNLAKQIPNLMSLVTALAYLMGMVFIFQGILKLKHAGEMRTMMSQEHGLAGPLILIAVGAMLLYFPTTVQIGMSTFWTNPNPYGYVAQKDQWHQFINVCFLIVQFIGTISFIRGLVILSHLGGHGGQPGQFGKAMTHIIGGIFAINIYQFVQVVFGTLFGTQLF